MEINIESSEDNNEKIHVHKIDGVSPCIVVLIARLGAVQSIQLTTFEAEILAAAILKMVEKPTE